MKARKLSLVFALMLGACATGPTMEVGEPVPDPQRPDNPCFSIRPFKAQNNGVVTEGFLPPEFAGKACGDAYERKLLIVNSFKSLEYRMRAEMKYPEFEPTATILMLDIIRRAVMAKDVELPEIADFLERNGMSYLDLKQRSVTVCKSVQDPSGKYKSILRCSPT